MTLRMIPVLVLLGMGSGSMAAPCQSDGEVTRPTVGLALRWDRPPATGFLNHLQREVEHIFRPTGLKFLWERNPKEIAGDRVVTVELRGACRDVRASDSRSEAPWRESTLGWTLVKDGKVLPYSILDCDQIARASQHFHRHSSGLHSWWTTHRRLAGLALAHELMHVLLQTRRHDAADLTHSPLRLDDLRIAPSFKPAQLAALRQIGHRCAAGPAALAAAGSAD
jgi:hypothetical protein